MELKFVEKNKDELDPMVKQSINENTLESSDQNLKDICCQEKETHKNNKPLGNLRTNSSSLEPQPNVKSESEITDTKAAENSAVKKTNDVFKMPLLPNNLPKSHTNVFDSPKLNKPVLKLNSKESLSKTKEIKCYIPESKNINNSVKNANKPVEISLPYKEPEWGGLSPGMYSLEVLKLGTIVNTVDLTTKSFYVFGRLASCNIVIEHPSSSRYHAILQYRAISSNSQSTGWYLYDLDSTHGTYLNKNKLRPRVYYRVRSQHIIKFGGSSRLHILQGPDDDQDEESEFTVTELKQQREEKELEVERRKKAEEEKAKESENIGCTWGMGEDAVEEGTAEVDDGDIDLEGSTSLELQVLNEDLYIEDPKKALRGFFEREGCDPPEYKLTDLGKGQHQCQVELPIDSPVTNEPLVAEATVTGKKKEAVAACALEACRILDRNGELRKAKHEGRKRKTRNWEENDFYDSDEDTFLDRTGDIEKKRLKRIAKAGKNEKKVENFETLTAHKEKLILEIEEIERDLAKAKADMEAFQSEGMDALDAFMTAIKSGAMDSKSKMKLKHRLISLQGELAKTEKMLNIAKPALPSLLPLTSNFKPNTLLPKEKRGPCLTLPEQTKENLSTPDIGFDSVEELILPEVKSQDSSTPVCTRLISNTNLSHCPSTKASNPKPSSPKVTSDSSNKKLLAAIDTSNSSNEKPPSPNCSKNSSKDFEQLRTNNSPKPDATSKPDDTSKSDDTCKTNDTCKPASTCKQDNTKTEKDERDLKENISEPSLKPTKKIFSKSYCESDPDYAVWLPPSDQSGDGTTHLNSKYGY